MSHVFQVTSFHVWLIDNVNLPRWSDWEIHSVFEKAIYFTIWEHIITLSTAYDGPATIVTEGPLPSLVQGKRIGKQVCLSFSSSRHWVPPRFRMNPEEIDDQVLDGLRIAVQDSGRSAFLQPKFSPWMARGISALSHFFPKVAPGGSLFIGLGPGMTPAGDDFMCGYCHTLYHMGFKVDWAELALSADGTHFFSKEMLWWACRGVVAMPFEQVLLGVLNFQKNFQKFVRDALAIGHSSGADHLLGVWSALFLIKRKWRAQKLLMNNRSS